MLRDIQQAFPQAVLLGGDFVSGPLEALGAVLPTVPLLQFDMRSCPLPDRTVDAVVMLNVLEHIDRDADALREAWRILKPGGIAVIEVPAGPDLFDDYDRQLMHHRRYDMQTLAGRAREAGFEILRRSHLGFLVYPAFWAVKKKNRRFGTRTAEAGQRRVRSQIRYTRKLSLLGVAMQVELVLGKCVRFPAGIRCLVTGRKPAQV
jgi:SAM-dependent methyltransferase